MAYNIIGLDIGSRNVRALLFERNFRGYEVVEVREAAIPWASDGEGPQENGVSIAVEQVVGDLNRGQSTFVSAYPLERASVWFFRMPFNDPKRIAQTVHFEVEDMVPFDLEEMLFSYRVQRNIGETADLMAILAPRKEIARRLEASQALDVNPVALLLDAHALGNALPTKSAEPQAVLDVGHRRTLISVVRDGIVEHVQSVPGGGDIITHSLMDAWNLPFDIAEYLKHHRVLPPGYELDPAFTADSEAPTEEGELPVGLSEEQSPGEQLEDAAARFFEASGDSLAGDAPEYDDPELDIVSHDDRISRPLSPEGLPTLSWKRLGLEDEAPDLDSLEDAPGYGALIGEDEVTPAGRLPAHYRAVVEAVDEGYVDDDEVTEPGAAENDESEAAATAMEEEDLDMVPIPMGGEGPQNGPVTPQAVQEVIDASLARMIQPIRASLIAYEIKHRKELKALALAGGGSALPELAEVLELELGISAHPLSRLGSEQLSVPGSKHPASYALAFALGLRGVTDGRLHEVDFRREEFASRSDIHRVRVAGVLALAAILMIAFVGAALAMVSYQGLRSEASELEARIMETVAGGLEGVEAESFSSPTDAIGQLMSRQITLQDQAKILNVTDPRPPTALLVLQEVSKHLSPGEPGASDFVTVDIDEYQAGESAVRLKGYTNSFDATGKIEASLKKSPLFTDVTLGDVTSARGKDERKNFTLTFTISQEGMVDDDS